MTSHLIGRPAEEMGSSEASEDAVEEVVEDIVYNLRKRILSLGDEVADVTRFHEVEHQAKLEKLADLLIQNKGSTGRLRQLIRSVGDEQLLEEQLGIEGLKQFVTRLGLDPKTPHLFFAPIINEDLDYYAIYEVNEGDPKYQSDFVLGLVEEPFLPVSLNLALTHARRYPEFSKAVFDYTKEDRTRFNPDKMVRFVEHRLRNDPPHLQNNFRLALECAKYLFFDGKRSRLIESLAQDKALKKGLKIRKTLRQIRTLDERFFARFKLNQK